MWLQQALTWSLRRALTWLQQQALKLQQRAPELLTLAHKRQRLRC